MKKNYVFVAIIGLIILIAVITNPNQDRHEEVIKNKLNSYLQESMNESLNESNNDWEQAGKAIGLMLGGALIDRIIDNLISTDNYVIFSISKVTWDGKTKIIGIGVFGNVFLTRQLNESLDEGLLKKK
jgi:hypothetical protein